MSSIREPGAKRAYLRRAHHCVVAWGKGAPLRAVCTLKLKEVKMLTRPTRRSDRASRAKSAW